MKHMNRSKKSILVAATIGWILIGAETSAAVQSTAKGTLTVDSTTTAIEHVYFDQYREEFTIILADSPMEPEMIPDGIYSLSEQGKVRALEFTISRESQELLTRMRKSIYFHPIWTRNITIGNGVLTISRFDKEVLIGTIKTPSQNEDDEHSFSYDVSFSVSLTKEALKLTFTGKTDAPSKAYAAYSETVLMGDVEGFLKFVPQERIEFMPKDPQELVLGLEFVQSTMMTEVEILTSTITGDKAILTLAGRRGITTANGTVTMLLENDAWKVSEESWNFGDE